ncbi:MAG: hypothetical protein Sapg2KO_35120 [Saprospiraceae bacterium]
MLLVTPLKAADYYWIGGTGDWSDISNWATTSGGFLTHNQAPTADDNVYFDANSFTGPGQTVTLNGTFAFCRDMIWQAGTQNAVFTAAANATLNVFGSFQLSTEMDFDFQGDVVFQGANTGSSIGLAGQQFNQNVVFDGVGASWQFESDVVVDSLFIFYNGQLNSGSFSIVSERFYSDITSNGSNLNLENSVFTLSGIDLESFRQNPNTLFMGGNVPNAYSLDLATFVFNGSQTTVVFDYFQQIELGTIRFLSETGKSVISSFSGEIGVFTALEFQNNTSIEMGLETDSLILGGGKNFDFAAGQEYAIGFLDVQGNCQEPVFIQSANSGEPVFFLDAGNGLNLVFTTLRDIHTRGPGSFIADNSVDLGNNIGWTINVKSYAELYWVGGSGMWDDSDHWSFTSGGPGGACIPTPGEDVIFDANSFNGPLDMVMLNVENAYCKDMRWENPTGNPILNGIAENSLRIFGSLLLSQAMDFDFKGNLFFETQDPGQTITAANHVFSKDVTFNGTGGWILQDFFQVQKDLNFLSGNLNTNDQDLNIRRFNGNTSTQRTLNLTSSYVTLKDTIEFQYLWWEIGGDNLVLDAGTSTIDFKNAGRVSMYGNNSLDFHKVIHASSGFQADYSDENQNSILGIDTLVLSAWNETRGHIYAKHITMMPGYVFYIQQADTLSFDSIVVIGGCGNFVEMRSNLTNQTAFVKPSQSSTVSDLLVKDLHNETGFDLMVINGADLGNNVGWSFMEPEGRELYWVNDGGDWRDTIHWSLSSGGPGGECPPGPNDNVYFDVNSFSNPNELVNATPVTYCKDMDWTGATGQPRFSFFEHQNFGALQFIDDMTVSGSTIRFRTDSLDTSIDTKGKYFWRSIFDGAGSWSLQDSLDVFNFEHITGDLTTNGVNLKTRRSSFSSPNKKILDMRGSYWSLVEEPNNPASEWYVEGNTMETVLAEGSTVELTGQNPTVNIRDNFSFDYLLSSNTSGNTTFTNFPEASDSIRFHHLELRNSAVFGGTMYGDTILLSAGKTYELDPDAILLGREYIQMIGNNCTPIELKSKFSGRQADLVTDMGVVKADFVQMQDIRAVGNIDFYAGIHSTDIANNTNWIFDSAEDFVDEGFLGQDKVICDASTITLDANNFSPNETYLWQDGSSDSTFVTNQPGLFFVEVMFANNCSIRDSVRVIPQQDFQPNLPDTTSILCVGDTLLLDANLDLVGLKYVWQDSSTAPSFVVSGPGEYKVSLELGGCTNSDSTRVREVEYPTFSLGNDVTLCADSTLLLDVTTDTASYQWLDGSTNPTFLVSGPGIVWADVSYEQCTTRDSIEIAYFDPIPLELGRDTTICEETSLNIAGNVPGATFTWSDGSTNAFLTVDLAGDYSVEAILNGCPAYDTISVALQELPRFELGPDTAICTGESILLDGNSLPGTTYEWSDGSNNPTLAVSSAGTFALEATLNNCTFVDIRSITVKPLPLVDLGQDQILCEEETSTLTVNQANATYEWQDGSTESSFVVGTDGAYSVAVTLDGCVDQDTVNFTFNPLPRFELGQDTAICAGESITFDGTSLAGATYEWNDGSTQATLTASTEGTYSLEARLAGCAFSDTRNLRIKALPIVDLGMDQVLCEEETFSLDVTQANASYNWQDGTTSSTYTVVQAGDYSVDVNIEGCIVSDTVNFMFNPIPRFNLGADTLLCEGESLLLDGTVIGNTTYAWNDGSGSPTLTVSSAGVYTLTADLAGCAYSDEIAVDYGIIPGDLLGMDQIRCEEEVINFNLNVANATYAWINGATSPDFTISEAGTYGVRVNIGRCVGGDTINVSYNPLPRFNLGNDTLLCEGEQLSLNISALADSYQWQDGSTNMNFQVSFPGSYQATATLDGCSFTDAVNVDFQVNRTFSLGPDTTICEDIPILLTINQPADQIRWQDGSSGRSLSVSDAGTYSVEVIDGACSFSDEIIIDTRDCFRFRMYRPSAFSPNSDGINDEFLVDIPPNTIIESFDMKIYDRWGNLIFTSGDINTGWNGLIQGQPADNGVYVYSIRVKYQDDFRMDEEVISGDVLLIR